MIIQMPVLDRLIPKAWDHVEKHPLRLAAPRALVVERLLDVPRQYRAAYDQGQEGACVGYGQSWMMSILNRKRYSPRTLYKAAQQVDEWPGEDYEGTSLKAGFDILRDRGHWRHYAGVERPVESDEGIERNDWATDVDGIRAAIAAGIPVNLGINWYQEFGAPREVPRDERREVRSDPSLATARMPRIEYYIGTSANWGRVLGGHDITCVGASDARQALALCNTWGQLYPFIVWLPYEAKRRLLAEEGEAGVPIDRVRL